MPNIVVGFFLWIVASSGYKDFLLRVSNFEFRFYYLNTHFSIPISHLSFHNSHLKNHKSKDVIKKTIPCGRK